MTEISEAAKRKARELIDAGSLNAAPGDPVWVIALARVLQEHSDVAKDVVEFFSYGDESQRMEARLQSLILPDEPCAHTLSPYALERNGSDIVDYTFRVGARCLKCGKTLKIVEADDA